jgi:ABC-type oligopeptide transport system substrate-binding subunit
LVGTYRPEEISIGRGEEQHPLEKVIAELKRIHGNVWIDLDRTVVELDKAFIDELVDTEPNRFSTEFRSSLYNHTEGHPLFTLEILRNLQARGDLVQDYDGHWIEGPELDWEVLPARVEGVIEERIGRLEDELKETLSIASVEGEDFTAQVLARVQAAKERTILQRLTNEIEKRHRLIRTHGEEKIGKDFLNRYQFTHSLIQQYLYNGLGDGERRILHREIAQVLEELYSGETDQIAVQLARHFEIGGQIEKAFHYLQIAGDRARNAYANEEALENYSRLLKLSQEIGDQEKATRTLMKMALTFHTDFQFKESREAYEQVFEIWKQIGIKDAVRKDEQPASTLRLATIYGVKTLDSTRTNDADSTKVIIQLFSGLVETTPELESVPDVAQSWEILDRGTRYIFHLRDDVLWSDGIPVTAEDFEFAWMRVLSPSETNSTELIDINLLYDVRGAKEYHQGQIKDPELVGIRAKDKSTFEVILKNPVSYFPHLLSNTITFPVPKHIVNEHGNDWVNEKVIVTNGPFRIQEIDNIGFSLFERNPTYHGRFDGNVTRVQYEFVDAQTLASQYARDSIDILSLAAVGFDTGDQLRLVYPNEFFTSPRLGHTFLGFNCSIPPLDDERIRKALCLAIDQETMAHLVCRGLQFPAVGGVIPPGIPGHSPQLGCGYYPDRARDLLSSAGYPNGAGFPELEAWAPDNPTRELQVNYLESQWRKILGIKIPWIKSNQYWDRMVEGIPPLRLIGLVADVPDPDNFIRVGWPSLSAWNNEEFNELVSRARESQNQQNRIQNYQRADRIVMEELPVAPLLYYRENLLIKPWISRFPISSMGSWETLWKDIVIEPH